MKRSLTCIGLAIALLSACGGVSREQVLRSQREYDLAVGLYGEQDVPGAFEHLLEAIELDPDNSDAHLLLGNLFMIHRSDYRQAEHHMPRGDPRERGDRRPHGLALGGAQRARRPVQQPGALRRRGHGPRGGVERSDEPAISR